MNIAELDRSACTGCFACMAACKFDAITSRVSPDGFFYPEVNAERCRACGRCGEVCPINGVPLLALPKSGFYGTFQGEGIAYSSSGGVFPAIVAAMGPDSCFAGVCWTEQMTALQRVETDPSQLGRYQGSKYVQADMRNVYAQIQEQLCHGKKVFYFGLPCQIAGVRSFFESKADQLVLIELLCHGVPSPVLFARYVRELETRHGSRMTDFSFRFRPFTKGTQFIAKASYADGTDAIEYDNDYTAGFLRDLYLRDSCYHCAYATDRRVGDLIVGDAWGVQEGASLLIPMTEKGNDLLTAISPLMPLTEIPSEELTMTNGALRTEQKDPSGKKEFFSNLDEEHVILSIRNALPKSNFKGKLYARMEKARFMHAHRNSL
ncbi:MAG: 4Fe-4S dicluster domain-containing protein [Clostridiales bacterium]|nr:4Fe-4S dicluster domain-containing protein [Clostridiales bacterium]